MLTPGSNQSAGLSDAILNEDNVAAEDPQGQPLFQISRAHFKHWSEADSLCKAVSKHSNTRRNNCVDAKLNHPSGMG